MMFRDTGIWPARAAYSLAQLPPLAFNLEEAITFEEAKLGKPWTSHQRCVCYRASQLNSVTRINMLLLSRSSGNLTIPKFLGATWNPMFTTGAVNMCNIKSFRTHVAWLCETLSIGSQALMNLAGNPDMTALHILNRVNLLPEGVLGKFVKMAKGNVLFALVVRPDLSPAQFKELSYEVSFSAQGYLAANESLPEDLVRERAGYDFHADVRQVVATRTDLPEDVAIKLANDTVEGVRQAIANNLNVNETTRVIAALSSNFGTV